jgi:hypothetical protein
MTSWEFDRTPTPEPRAEKPLVEMFSPVKRPNSADNVFDVAPYPLVDEPHSLQAVDDFLKGNADGADSPDGNSHASFPEYGDSLFGADQADSTEQSFKISLANMLPYLLKIPNENIQDQTVKTLTLLCEPLGEIREYFSMTMVDTIIPEICTNYNPEDQQ